MINVKFKKLHPDAVIPSKINDLDAGFDLVAVTNEYLGGEQIEYGTGLAIEIPEGYMGLLFPRSSICKTRLSLANSVGVIDSQYRGEIKLVFNEKFGDRKLYYHGERIAQLVILPYPHVKFIEVDDLTQTPRGTGGFGSTGVWDVIRYGYVGWEREGIGAPVASNSAQVTWAHPTARLGDWAGVEVERKEKWVNSSTVTTQHATS